MLPSQFIWNVSGPRRVGAGSRMEPGACVFQKPSKTTMPTSTTVAIVESTDGIDSRRSGMNTVGMILLSAGHDAC